MSRFLMSGFWRTPSDGGLERSAMKDDEMTWFHRKNLNVHASSKESM